MAKQGSRSNGRNACPGRRLWRHGLFGTAIALKRGDQANQRGRRSSSPAPFRFPRPKRSGLTASRSSYSRLAPHHRTSLRPPASPGRWPSSFSGTFEVAYTEEPPTSSFNVDPDAGIEMRNSFPRFAGSAVFKNHGLCWLGLERRPTFAYITNVPPAGFFGDGRRRRIPWRGIFFLPSLRSKSDFTMSVSSFPNIPGFRPFGLP